MLVAEPESQPALVNGNLIKELPRDLYIPPDALKVFLETFEGPLDLLLYLIKRQNLDILGISIAKVTQQYVEYIEMMNRFHVELAAEYLLMAALLAEIKSRMLLPRPVNDEDDDDPRAELIRRLREYERFKEAAKDLDQLPRCERDIFETHIDTGEIEIIRLHPKVEMSAILIAFQEVIRRTDQLSHHHIQKEPLSVLERMSKILECLQHSEKKPFFSLFSQQEGKGGAVVSLLAILELTREGLIELVQPEALSRTIREASKLMELRQIIEAVLFAADKPLTIAQLQSVFVETERPEKVAIRKVIDEISDDYRTRPIQLQEVASGFRFLIKKGAFAVGLPLVRRTATKIFQSTFGNLGDYCLPSTGHPWRHRGDSWSSG